MSEQADTERPLRETTGSGKRLASARAFFGASRRDKSDDSAPHHDIGGCCENKYKVFSGSSYSCVDRRIRRCAQNDQQNYRKKHRQQSCRDSEHFR
jgi:hypothetical protein